MNILLFGATGFIGSSLVPYLIRQNHSLTVVCRNEHHIPFATTIKVNNLFDISRYSKAISEADVVIYLAGLAHVINKASYKDISSYLESNYYPLTVVAQLAAFYKVKKFIFFSTAKVLGEFTVPGAPFLNSSIPNPSNSYSYSKYLSEQFLLNLSPLCSTDFVILRPPLVYGERAKGNIKSLVNILRSSIPIPLASVRFNKRSMISLENINKFVTAVLAAPQPINTSLLISDGTVFSTVEFVKYISSIYGLVPKLFHFPTSILLCLTRLLKPNYYMTLMCSFELDISETCEILNFYP